MPGQTAGWDRLRLRLQSTAPPLYPPPPRPAATPAPRNARPAATPAPRNARPAATPAPLNARPAGTPAPDCAVCRGPVRPGFVRCYQCDRHTLLARGLLADVVVPVSYAIKGTPYADALWRYKSLPLPPSPAPPLLLPTSGPAPTSDRIPALAVASPSAWTASDRASILALLLAFLSDHGRCVWQRAGMPPPDCLAVVPTGAGRPGPHPLLELISPYLRLPDCPLALRPGRQGRDLDLDRFQVLGGPAGASVLLLDDTWVSGASAQSAAAALKLAGARHVAVIVLGRHINPHDRASAPLLARLTAARYTPSACAVHPPSNGTNSR